MIRQFFRLYLTIMIPVLVLVALAHHYGSHANSRAAYVEGLRTGLDARFADPRADIAALKLQDWEAGLPTLRAAFPSDLEIDVATTAMRRLNSNAGETARFQAGDVAFVLKKHGYTRAYQVVPGTPLVVSSQVVIPSDEDVSATIYVIAAVAVISTLVLWLWFHPSWLALERLGLLTEEVATAPRSSGSVRGSARFSQPFATSIDRISSRLDDLLRMRSTQSNSVAHELTAPIAQLSFALEILKENPTAGANSTLVSRMREDLNELDQLVAESLEFARLGSSKSLFPSKNSITALMQSAVEGALKLHHDGKQITAIPLEGEADTVYCDARQIGRALSNLLRNATRYARTSVMVSAEQIDATLWVHVDDDGPGIPEAYRTRLFEPFARVEDHTVGASRGYGLGLAIVQQIAELHGGFARIDASPLGGARVSIGW